MSIWASGAAYEPYVGRWSRLVAREFLAWLAVPPESRWADVGCGTGALSATILAVARPSAVTGIDASEGYVAHAREQIRDRRAEFRLGDAQQLPFESATFDAAVSGDVAVRAIDVPTVFRDFDDYWSPFLGGQGPAPAYAMSLTEERRAALRDRIRAILPTAGDGSVHLMARAWAARGRSAQR